MLSNEKYIALIRLLDKGEQKVHYVYENNYLLIISKEKLEAVQVEKKKRINVVKTKDGNKRKSKKYTSRKN